jgi:DNA-binding NarL/FixJ family response regulator
MARTEFSVGSVKIVLLSFHASPELARIVIKSGNSAYVVKSSVHIDLIEALRAVVRNQIYVSPSLQSRIVRSA